MSILWLICFLAVCTNLLFGFVKCLRIIFALVSEEAQWKSARVIQGCLVPDSLKHCGVSLSRTFYPLLSTDSK